MAWSVKAVPVGTPGIGKGSVVVTESTRPGWRFVTGRAGVKQVLALNEAYRQGDTHLFRLPATEANTAALAAGEEPVSCWCMEGYVCPFHRVAMAVGVSNVTGPR